MDAANATTNILVTGAGRGLGLEFVKQLLARPATAVFAAARNPAAAAELQALQSQHASTLTLLELDVGSEASVQAAAKKMEESGVHLDILINNAAVGSLDSFLEADAEYFLNVMKVNVVGPYLMVKYFIPFLRAGSKKTIINIGSRVGSIEATLEPVPPSTLHMVKLGFTYRNSKAALNHETAFWAKNLEPEGFMVVCLHPGFVATDMGNWSTKTLKIKPPTSPFDSVAGMLKVMDGLDKSKDNGKFLTFQGEDLPW